MRLQRRLALGQGLALLIDVFKAGDNPGNGSLFFNSDLNVSSIARQTNDNIYKIMSNLLGTL